MLRLCAAALVLLVVVLPATAFAQAPGMTPPLSAPPAPPPRSGMTYEVAAGLGLLHVPDGLGDSATEAGLSGLNIGIGAFLSPTWALTLRATGLIVSDDGDVSMTGFFGPSLQLWASDHVWLRGGVGVGYAIGFGDDPGATSGLALDTGLGYSWSSQTASRNAYSVSVELIPTFLSGTTVTNASLLVGYQFL
jgi:hypothetical protein